MNRGAIIDNYIDNEKIFRFPYFNTSHEYEKLKLEEEKTKIALSSATNPKTYNIIKGKNILADQTAYNNMFNTVLNVKRYQRNLNQKKKLLGFKFKPTDYDNYTIAQLKTGLYIDFFDMCNELLLIDKITLNNLDYILSKNYRKLIILCIILITFLISYLIINILAK
jgi:hypothetical protein